MKEVSVMLKAIHSQEDIESVRVKATAVADKRESMKLKSAAQKVCEGAQETFSYYPFPSEHWRLLRTNNMLSYYPLKILFVLSLFLVLI